MYFSIFLNVFLWLFKLSMLTFWLLYYSVMFERNICEPIYFLSAWLQCFIFFENCSPVVFVNEEDTVFLVELEDSLSSQLMLGLKNLILWSVLRVIVIIFLFLTLLHSIVYVTGCLCASLENLLYSFEDFFLDSLGWPGWFILYF